MKVLPGDHTFTCCASLVPQYEDFPSFIGSRMELRGKVHLVPHKADRKEVGCPRRRVKNENLVTIKVDSQSCLITVLVVHIDVFSFSKKEEKCVTLSAKSGCFVD